MTKPKFEPDKFIVINLEHIKSIKHLGQKGLIKGTIQTLKHLLSKSRVPKNNYYVCNKNEPYAQKVLDVILEGERDKTEQSLIYDVIQNDQ